MYSAFGNSLKWEFFLKIRPDWPEICEWFSDQSRQIFRSFISKNSLAISLSIGFKRAWRNLLTLKNG